MSYILTHTTLTATRLFWLMCMWPEWFPHLTSPCIFFQYFSSSSSREYCQCYKSMFWLSLILVKFYFVSFQIFLRTATKRKLHSFLLKLPLLGKFHLFGYLFTCYFFENGGSFWILFSLSFWVVPKINRRKC